MAIDLDLKDNPFRLLGVGSCTPITKLRLLASAMEKQAAVGISIECAALTHYYPQSDYSTVAANIRAITTDHVLRTSLRILWPVEQDGVKLVEGSRTTFTSFEVQLDFIRSWIAFTFSEEPHSLDNALHALDELLSDIEFESLLTKILVEEGLPHERAEEILGKAIEMVQQHVLDVASKLAGALLEGETPCKGLSLLQVILDSPLDDDAEDIAIGVALEAGARIAKECEITIASLSNDIPGEDAGPPAEIELLDQLANVVGTRNPISAIWKDTADRWFDRKAIKMREYGLDLNANDKNSAALEVIESALGVSRSKKLQHLLKEDIAALQVLVKKESNYKGLKKISGAPSTGTINGIGAKLYGQEVFPGGEGLYYTIHYFTFFFIPILPLGRYLVKREGDMFQFFGKSEWTPGMKFHFGIVAAAMLWFVVPPFLAGGSVIDGEQSDSNAQSYSIPDMARGQAGTEVPPSTPDPKIKPTEDTVPVGGTVEGESPYMPPKPDRSEVLTNKLEDLKSKIDSTRGQIASLASEIDAKNGSLRSKRSRIDSMNPDPYSQSEIDEYNNLVEEYEKARKVLNGIVEEHNNLIAEERTLVRKYNEIVEELTGM